MAQFDHAHDHLHDQDRALDHIHGDGHRFRDDDHNHGDDAMWEIMGGAPLYKPVSDEQGL